MLGSIEQEQRRERARFANELFGGVWTAPAVRVHEGYARDRFRWLLALKRPPLRTGSTARELERLTWNFWRCFALLQGHRRRLAHE